VRLHFQRQRVFKSKRGRALWVRTESGAMRLGGTDVCLNHEGAEPVVYKSKRRTAGRCVVDGFNGLIRHDPCGQYRSIKKRERSDGMASWVGARPNTVNLNAAARRGTNTPLCRRGGLSPRDPRGRSPHRTPCALKFTVLGARPPLPTAFPPTSTRSSMFLYWKISSLLLLQWDIT
jgi:hypothetical protein